MVRKLKKEHSHGGAPVEVGGGPSGLSYSLTAEDAAVLAVALHTAVQDVLRGDLRETAAKRWRVWILPAIDKGGKTGRLQVHTGDW
jgi:hypothetical protein